MSVMELLASRRTYRRFEQKAVPQDVVEDIIEALRLSSCGANRQAVRLVVVNRPEDVARVQPLVKWAAYLPPEQGGDRKVSVTGNGLVQTPSVALRAPAPAAREAARHPPWWKEFLHICSFSFSAMHNCYQFGFKSSDFLHKY